MGASDAEKGGLLTLTYASPPEWDCPPPDFEVINHRINNQSSGVATGWGSPLTEKKFAKNWKKEGENKSGQKGQNQEKEEKSGRLFHFAPPDR